MAYADFLELNRRQARREAGAAARHPAGERTANAPATARAAACFLAYLGAAPLLAAALVLVGDPLNTSAPAFLVLYGAALLIFFGGVRWGVAVMKPQGPTMRALFGAGLPMIAAMPLIALGDAVSASVKLIALMALMAVLLFDDLSATRRGEGAPIWYLGVRVPLTVLIEVAFLVALAASMRG